MKTGGLFESNWKYLLWGGTYVLIATLILGARWESFLVSIVIYGISIAIALSSAGEAILKFMDRAQVITEEKDKARLLPLFDEVYRYSKKYNPNLNVSLYIVEEDDLNAYAIGRTSVVLNRGLINTFSEEELQGVIAHELAHIVNGDTKARLLNVVGNGIFSVCIAILRFAITVGAAIGGQGTTIGKIVESMLRLLLNLSIFVFLTIGQIILSANSRQSEYLADEYALKLGFGDGLISGLEKLKGLGEDQMTFFERIKSSHPYISDRIERLKILDPSKIVLPHSGSIDVGSLFEGDDDSSVEVKGNTDIEFPTQEPERKEAAVYASSFLASAKAGLNFGEVKNKKRLKVKNYKNIAIFLLSVAVAILLFYIAISRINARMEPMGLMSTDDNVIDNAAAINNQQEENNVVKETPGVTQVQDSQTNKIPLNQVAPFYDRSPDVDPSGDRNGVGNRDFATMGGTIYDNVLVFRFGNGGSLTQFSLHNLNSQYEVFSGYVGRVDGGEMTDATINIFGDERLLYTYGISSTDMPAPFTVIVEGVAQLRIEMEFPNEWGSVDYAIVAYLK